MIMKVGNYSLKITGGTTQIVTQKEANAKGTVIVFPSAILHRVTPVTKGARYSLVQWYNGPDFI